MASIALRPVDAVSRALSRAIRTATRHVRWTVLVSIVLIFGSFVSAAVIQMRRDRAHALDQAAFMESRRAQELAADLGPTLDRYAALGAAFADAEGTVETSAALSQAGGPGLQNIVVLERSGHLLSEMKRPPRDLLPLDAAQLRTAAAGRAIFVADGGQSLVLAFPEDAHVVLVQIATRELFPPSIMADELFATPDGEPLAIGRNWRELPSKDSIALSSSRQQRRILDLATGRRLVVLSPVPKWPVVAAASVEVGDALSGWYGALPLYFFFILGPAFAGAGLAVVLVREFERHTRPSSADRLLKAKRGSEAKLLIRLADAERRAAEATRSKAEFITHMSHELRTPLNAIIGFSEVIERDMFGHATHPKYREYARDINQAGLKLHSRIDEVLEFANLETARQGVVAAPVNLAEIMRQAVDELAGRAFTRQIRISTSWPVELMALADAPALRRALNNLLLHSLHHTREGGILRVQMRQDASGIAISVHDLALRELPDKLRAHQHFAQADRSGAEFGAGLNLMIASSLIRRIGGVLTVTGKPGEGQRLDITLRAPPG